jgi:hypothetical protein
LCFLKAAEWKNMMNKIYLWLGLTTKTEEEYWNYFYITPQFCLDVGLDWLDEDFMGYYYSKNTNDLKRQLKIRPNQLFMTTCIKLA